jgi:multicomponent Na+:H+ antiporter subunit F
MSVWSIGVWALLPAFAVPILVALRGTVAARMVAVQLATALAITMLMVMSFAFDQESYVSLAAALAIMNLAGTLVVAATVERWL